MPQPTKIPRPFADSGDKNSIPDSSGSVGFASWRDGFPAITSEPFAQGGVAPKRADFNGIFNVLSAATVWNQQGGVYAYDNATDYEVGNVVLYSGDLYKCLVANGPSSAVKAPTDTATWDRIATASGFLPLSGGTLTGRLQFRPSDGNARLQNNLSTYDGSIDIYGGAGYTTGAYARLYGKSHSSYPGAFFLTATDGTNTSNLNGKPDGTLTWGGNNVITAAGGTITGTINTKDIYIDNGAIRQKADTQPCYIYGGMGWRHGGQVAAFGKSDSVNPGAFSLRADNGTDFKVLWGKTDGTLTWDGNDVAIIQTGTWTPILAGETTEGSLSYSTREGNYVKIGRLVLLQCKLVVSAVSTMPTGYALIRGLPYKISSAALLPLRGIGGDSNCARKVVFAANNANNSNQLRITGINPSSIATTGQIESLKWSSTSTGADNIKFANSNPFIEFNITGCYLTSA